MLQFILTSIVVFLIVIVLLVAVLLIAKKYLSPSGNVNIVINDDKTLSVPQGASLMSTLNENGIFLPSACGGKSSCGQCKVQVLEGGGEILDSERPHFTRKQIKDHWRLGCQCKVKGDLKIKVPESVLGVKEWECTVISNKNVSSFIKEFIVALPPGEHMNFVIGDKYLPMWEKFDMLSIKAHNPEPTVRAYSMANYPAEGDRIMLTVRIATPPFKPKPQVGFQDVPTGIASSYIFSRKPGDKVIMSGPYGDFHPIFDSKKEMIWVGGGAGMAPLRSQIMHMTKTLNTRNRELHYFYGARSLAEVFYLNDFLELEKEFDNFHFHLALDRPDPEADKAGVKYTAGFVHNVLYETYLKQHENPEDYRAFVLDKPVCLKKGIWHQVLALTHLEEMSARLIRNLSMGYRQRVGLAQAILGFPKIIILDEPTVGLDPKQVVEIRELIRHLSRGHTVIISSHILSEIRAVCDRVLIIRKGRFVVCDTPDELEERLSAGGSLELTAKAAPEQAEPLLRSVQGVVSCTLLGQTADSARFSVRTEGDVREALFFAFAEARCPLVELRPRMASLEEVFLDLTDDDDTVAAQAAALFQAPAAPAEKEGSRDEGDL